ncbi:unnamed protein product [Sphenostylis stenocarpa]|uniref:Uncharacterized protein n=1 Tax=Sphenostylis stenocarpa TaxID=92480 RepID=A0AA87B972_9FABA|nr:unnamed protein product [Sphenostylis stenocarpa]
MRKIQPMLEKNKLKEREEHSTYYKPFPISIPRSTRSNLRWSYSISQSPSAIDLLISLVHQTLPAGGALTLNRMNRKDSTLMGVGQPNAATCFKALPDSHLVNPISCQIYLQEPEPIDWDYYRKGIGTRLVDLYKEHYENMFVNPMKPTRLVD